MQSNVNACLEQITLIVCRSYRNR